VDARGEKGEQTIMAGPRTKIPGPKRSRLLVANQHSCCVCGGGGVQIHHIDSNPSHNDYQNLAVLCTCHHDKATAPSGLTAKLTPSEIRKYKDDWETRCLERLKRAGRSRTAFFMLDYKNADRIRQLFSQLTQAECAAAYDMLTGEFQEEEVLRQQQRFSISLEPNTRWNSATERMLSWVRAADAHPEPFHDIIGHPKDLLYPTGGAVDSVRKAALYDLWCQIMVRAVLATRLSIGFEDLLAFDEPSEVELAGSLLTFDGTIRGDVPHPSEWRTQPTSSVVVRCTEGNQSMISTLALKTHYVYSDTAAMSLSKGRANGVLVFRGVEKVIKRGRKRRVEISASPLLIGTGVLEM
jgi:hypothetical protein